jgi:hypothetical protein
VVKALLIFGMLSALLIVASSGFSDARIGSAQPRSEARTSLPTAAATAPSPHIAVGPVAASSGTPTSGATHSGNNHLPTSLSTYVLLHETWDENISASAGLSRCAE